MTNASLFQSPNTHSTQSNKLRIPSNSKEKPRHALSGNLCVGHYQQAQSGSLMPKAGREDTGTSNAPKSRLDLGIKNISSSSRGTYFYLLPQDKRLRQFLAEQKKSIGEKGSLQLDQCWELWTHLGLHFRKQGATLLRPSVSVGEFSTPENSLVLFTWSMGQHYLECEVEHDGEICFFYRDRETGNNWLHEFHMEKSMIDDLEDYLWHFIV